MSKSPNNRFGKIYLALKLKNMPLEVKKMSCTHMYIHMHKKEKGKIVCKNISFLYQVCEES